MKLINRNHNHNKMVIATTITIVSLSYLLTVSAQPMPQQPQKQQQPQPQPQQIKVEIPKEDLELLKRQKEIELYQTRIQQEQMKDTYEVDKLNRQLTKKSIKRNIIIQDQLNKALNSLAPQYPTISIPVSGIIGKVAITPNIAITEGTQVYNYQIKKVSATKGIQANGTYINIYNATQDTVLPTMAGIITGSQMGTNLAGMPTGNLTGSPIINLTQPMPPTPISTLPPPPMPTQTPPMR